MTTKTAAKGGFTPAPWAINDKGAQITIQWFDEKGWGCTVATIDPGSSSLPMAEIRANARIIAAAPQMYAKLLDLSIKIDAASGQPSFTAKESDELNELLEGHPWLSPVLHQPRSCDEIFIYCGGSGCALAISYERVSMEV